MKKLTTIEEVRKHENRPLLKSDVFKDYLNLTADLEKTIKTVVEKEIYEEKIKPVIMKQFQYVCNNFVNLATYLTPNKDGSYQTEY